MPIQTDSSIPPSKRRAGAGRRPSDATPRAHKLRQGKALHLPYFLSAWKLHRFPSCKGSSVPKNFSKAMTSFQDRTVYGGGEPGLIIGTGKGERGVWKSSTFPAAGSTAARPRLSPTVGAPQRAAKPKARRMKTRDLVLLTITIPLFWKDKGQRKSWLTPLPDSYVLRCRREAPRGERDPPLLRHRLSTGMSTAPAAEINAARTEVAQSYIGNTSVQGSLRRPHLL